MIVEDAIVSLALEVLGDGERAYRVHLNAGNKEFEAEEAYANALILHRDGTVAEREARATLSNSYGAARREEIKAHAELKRFQHETTKATKVIDVWQTESANVRAMERIR